MNANSTVRLKVEGGGDQVVAHVGLHAVGAFADRLRLGHSLSARIPVTGERLPLHDRGEVLVQGMLMLAGGGKACSDIEHLRAQERLFGSVASDSTLYRTPRAIDEQTLAGLWEAMAEVWAEVWRRSAATTGSAPVVLDIDSSLVEIHSETKRAPVRPTGQGRWRTRQIRVGCPRRQWWSSRGRSTSRCRRRLVGDRTGRRRGPTPGPRS